MAMPERFFQGETRIIEGVVFSRSGVGIAPGMTPILTLRKDLTKIEIEGAVIDHAKGRFMFTLPKSLTASMELGTWSYEVSIRSPDGSESYLVEQGQVDLVTRL